MSVPCLLCTHTHTRVCTSVHLYTCTQGSCTCQCWCAHKACATMVSSCTHPAHTWHALGTALHTHMPVSILTSCLLLRVQVLWGCLHPGVCWFAHVCSPWHVSWLMHRLCSPFPAVAVVTNGLKLGRGLPGVFLYIYVSFCISLCKHLHPPLHLMGAGWAEGFAAGDGHQG